MLLPALTQSPNPSSGPAPPPRQILAPDCSGGFVTATCGELYLGTPESGGEFPLTGLTRLTSLVLTGNTHAHPGLGRPLNSASGFVGARPPAQARIGIGEGVAQLPQLQELHMDGLVDAVPAGGQLFAAWWGGVSGSCPSCGSEKVWRLGWARVGGQGGACMCRQLTAPVGSCSCGVDCARGVVQLWNCLVPCPATPRPIGSILTCTLTPRHCSHPLPLADLWQCSALTHLVIRGTPSADPSYDEDERLLPELPPVDGARLPHLRTLCLRGCATPPGLLGQLLAATPQLTALALGDLEFWGGDGGDGSAELVEELKQLAKLTALQELDLSTLEVWLGGRFIKCWGSGALALPSTCMPKLHLPAARPPAPHCCDPQGGLGCPIRLLPHPASTPLCSCSTWHPLLRCLAADFSRGLGPAAALTDAPEAPAHPAVSFRIFAARLVQAVACTAVCKRCTAWLRDSIIRGQAARAKVSRGGSRSC